MGDDDIDLLAEICDDPDDEDSDYGRGWQDGCRAGYRDAATPDGPRRWALPDDASTVIAYLTDPGRLPLGTSTVVDLRGQRSAHAEIQLPLGGGAYGVAVVRLTDATPAADGQDGDGRG